MNRDRDMGGKRDAVARAFGIEPAALLGRARTKRLALARQTAYWVVRRAFPGASYPAIGRLFAGRDHSTIIYGVAEIDKRRAHDAEFRSLTDALAWQDTIAPVTEAVIDKLLPLPRENAPLDPQEAMRLREVRIKREIAAMPDPKPYLLGLQLKGEAGCPRLDETEVDRRRAQVQNERRAREIALLEQERIKYRLPRRGLALSEMAL